MKRDTGLNPEIYEQYFDREFIDSLVENIVQPLNQYYFRTRMVGFDDLPERNDPKSPLIYLSNHSGMAFPWDAMIFVGSFIKKCSEQKKHNLRALVAPLLSASDLMCPYMVPDFWKRVGGVDATMPNFETMMQQEESNILIYPEGVPGIGKGFNRRYQLQQFSTSFLRMSLKYKTDIVIVSTVNAEYINPYSYNVKSITRFVQKLGLPFLPIGLLTLLILLQPWIFYLGLPANLTYVMGPRIKPYEMIDKPYEQVTKPELRKIRDEIQKIFQEHLNQSVERYGQKPYRIGSYIMQSIKNIHKLPLMAPPSWPILFREYMRNYDKTGSAYKLKLNLWTLIKGFLFNLSTIFYYIPVLGLFPLAIIGYKNNRLKEFNQKKRKI